MLHNLGIFGFLPDLVKQLVCLGCKMGLHLNNLALLLVYIMNPRALTRVHLKQWKHCLRQIGTLQLLKYQFSFLFQNQLSIWVWQRSMINWNPLTHG